MSLFGEELRMLSIAVESAQKEAERERRKAEELVAKLRRNAALAAAKRVTKGTFVVKLLASDPKRKFTVAEIREHLKKQGYMAEPCNVISFLNNLKANLKIDGEVGCGRRKPVYFARVHRPATQPIGAVMAKRSEARQRVAA